MNNVRYSHRPYRLGDEDAINALYFRITGRKRSREQWAWQWQQAPAGPGDIWLIEATHPDGQVELIGHHGIMPIRFTWGERDLLFGKTENTMVLPEYRTKILYPRFERRFAAEYEPRYHALFSTMGPVAAIRQRQAMGYVAENYWLDLEQAYWPWGTLVRIVQHPRLRLLRKLVGFMLKPRLRAAIPDGVEFLNASEAREEPFLKKYSIRARKNWGISPSRTAEDLAWRYWDNPYSPRYAVIVRRPNIGNALFIVVHNAPGLANIEDFSIDNVNAEGLTEALQLSMIAVKQRLNVSLIRCGFTSDAVPASVLPALKQSFKPSFVSKLRNRRKTSTLPSMPRKLTEQGVEEGLANKPWNITMTISEGLN